MDKFYEVRLTKIYDCKQTQYYDVDLEDFKQWLDGEKPTVQLLKEYLNELDPSDYDDDYDEVDEFIEDLGDLFKDLENETDKK